MKFFSQQLPRKKFHFVMFQERYIIENRFKMPDQEQVMTLQIDILSL
jgi:hypothetical protein